jgi:hypothetical protein
MDHNSSSTIPTPSSSYNSPYNRSYSSNSTPATPNMSRYRTLTCMYIYHLLRSMSQTKSSRHKSKSSSRKRKSDKTNEH